jgi:hypothetical protein
LTPSVVQCVSAIRDASAAAIRANASRAAVFSDPSVA